MRQAIYTLICCFIALTAIQVQSTEEPKHNSKEPCTNPCRNQGDPANPPITINISPTQTLSSGATEKHENKNDKSSWEKWTSIGTLILAFFTFALAGTALWQRFDTKKSSEKQLRAYVHIYPGLLWEQNERTAEMFEARPMMKNNGQTPAYNVVYTGITKILPAVVPGNFDFSLAQHPFPSKGTLGPAQDLTLYPATERLY